MNGRIGIALAVGIAGCATTKSQTVEPPKPLASATPQPAAPREALPFIDDDYERAVWDARVSKKPIFVEAWAPW